eukprot:Blabericola_migrator_1__1893@NODE_1513_length_4373_cov_130_645146_g994_i0_p3_GENE_NODE_1513_length_4373_cov_130_645146_g994_i0NODE_1513_length_4373_cov_130_645146_g994_i0_p3_ORF_typecomplete_len279_score56_70AAA_lid_10/PF17872_1/0_00072AAA_lid_10/PF17872_1/4e03Cdc6_C/PF09079_11/0_00066_NODE_1513_length_4373_cov_130_645146_g994_i021773013
MRKIGARLERTFTTAHTLRFDPYTFDQLNLLVKSHTTHTTHTAAIEYGTRKVAGATGDCRQVMDMLARLKIDDLTSPTRDVTEGDEMIETPLIKSVQKILGTAFQTDMMRVMSQIESLTVQQQAVACGIAKAIVMHSAMGEERVWVKTSQTQTLYHSLCRVLTLQPVSSVGYRNVIDSLCVVGLLTTKEEPSHTQTFATPPRPRRLVEATSATRQRTPIKTPIKRNRVQSPGPPASLVTFNMSSTKVSLMAKKIKERGIARPFCLMTFHSNDSSDDDL